MRKATKRAAGAAVELARANERSLAEEALRRAAAFDEAVLKCLGEGVYTIDERGLVSSMNPAAEELFGWSFAELRGKRMHDITHHHYRDGRPFPASECAGFQVLEHGRPLKNHEDVFIRKDGSFFDVVYSIAPLRDAGGSITGLVVVFSDITDRKRAEENIRSHELALQRAIQARDDVLRIVAHDLRNPLSTILMQTGLLRRRGPEPERRSRKPVEAIERSASRMGRLIADLIDLTKMEAGSLAIEQARVAAGALVSDAIAAQEVLASAASLDLRLDLADDLPEIYADRERLLQVFENLIGNAVKFTEPGGQITVGARPRDGEVLFWVADTGAGLPDEVLPHIFERFWQGRRADHRGAGLGLPIVKGIVEAHGGRVWAESTPGRGSTFFFTVTAAPRVAV